MDILRKTGVLSLLLVFGAILFVLTATHTQADECAPGMTYAASPAADPAWWAEYTASVERDVASVTTYWSSMYPQLFDGAFPGLCATIEYELQSVPFAETCGLTADTARANAFYCIPANAVMWDGVNFFHPIYQNFGDKAITYIIAHEYGHAAQFLSGTVPPGVRTVSTELQADCYAGAYLAYAESQGYLSPGEGREVVSIAIAVGQSRIGTSWLERTHGTSAQRTAALNRGFEQGAQSCGQVDFESLGERVPDIEPGAIRDRFNNLPRNPRGN